MATRKITIQFPTAFKLEVDVRVEELVRIFSQVPKNTNFVSPIDSFWEVSTALRYILQRENATQWISSHTAALTVVKIALFIGVKHNVIVESLQAYTARDTYATMNGVGALYELSTLTPELVDFPTIFRDCKSLSPTIIELVTGGIKLSSAQEIEKILFFKNYDFGACFPGNDKDSADQVALMNKVRDDLGQRLFLMNPFDHADYFKFTPDTIPVWKCEGISIHPKPALGQSQLVDKAEFLIRLLKITDGVFERPLNPTVTTPFPFENVVFSGGLLTKIICNDAPIERARQADIDLFIHATNFADRSAVFERLIQWFDTSKTANPRTFFAVHGSVVTIYIKDIDRKFQIVAGDSQSAYGCIHRFDMTHVQWLYNGELYATPDGCKSLRERMSHLRKVPRLRTERMVKALWAGYDVVKPTWDIEGEVDLDPLLNEPDQAQLRKIIRGFHGYYYPKSDPTLGPDELDHILANIEKDSGAPLVTVNPVDVINNTTIGGNFESTYEAMLFEQFNPITLSTKQPNRHSDLPLRTKYGNLRMSTRMMKVHSIRHTDEGATITFMTPDALKTFISDVLESRVFRMYRNGTPDTNVVGEDGLLHFTFTIAQLNIMAERGRTCIRNQRGQPLSITEDLFANDDVQMVFSVVMKKYNDGFKLDPLRVVKHVKMVERVEPVEPAPEDIEELQEIAEIQYEDLY